MPRKDRGGKGTVMDVHKRAVMVSRIFDILAWVVLVAGGVGVLVSLISMFSDFLAGFLLLLATVVYTALVWAGVSLSTVVAGYIASRTGR